MKQLLLIILFFGATNLFAQQIDSTLIQEIPELQTTISNQQQEIEVLEKSVSEQQSHFDDQVEVIEDLQTQLEEQNRNIGILKSQVANQRSNINQQREAIAGLKDDNTAQNTKLDNLDEQTKSNKKQMVANSNELGTKIEQTGKTVSSNNSKINELDDSLSKNQLYWIIASLILLILGILIFLWLKNRIHRNKTEVENEIQSSKSDVETQIRNTKASLEEESVAINTKIIEVLDKQLKLEELNLSEKTATEEKDHSLVLKVADEVTKIQMSLKVMDQNIKGYKFLKKYATSILDNLKAYGYEIPQLIGKNYNPGMNMVATMEFDDSIEEGKQIIKRIDKPQIDYNGKMIQAANVVVAFNE